MPASYFSRLIRIVSFAMPAPSALRAHPRPDGSALLVLELDDQPPQPVGLVAIPVGQERPLRPTGLALPGAGVGLGEAGVGEGGDDAVLVGHGAVTRMAF